MNKYLRKVCAIMDSQSDILKLLKKVESASHLERLDIFEEITTKLKGDLAVLLEFIGQRESYFAKASRYWGKQSLGFKIAVGAGLVIPIFLLAVVTQLVAIFFICIQTMILYTLVSILLDDDSQCCETNQKTTQQVFATLFDILNEILGALSVICDRLEKNVAELTAQNKALSKQVQYLKRCVCSLKKSVHEINSIKKGLEKVLSRSSESQEHLQNEVDRLESVRKDQEVNLKKFQTLFLSVSPFMEQMQKISLEPTSETSKKLDEVATQLDGVVTKIEAIPELIRPMEERLQQLGVDVRQIQYHLLVNTPSKPPATFLELAESDYFDSPARHNSQSFFSMPQTPPQSAVPLSYQ